MHDVHASGACLVPSDADPAAARWLRRPPRLSRMDRLCALALVAAEGALADAGLDPASLPGERLAVVVGTRFGCHATNEAYFRGVLAEGVHAASPRLFAYTLPSSPLGEVSIHVGARGPAETVATGRHAGVEAILVAARICAAGLADAAIAIAVEVGGGTLPGLGYRCDDGAAAVIVERGAALAARGAASRARIVGGGLAFSAGRVDEARAIARARAAAEAGMAEGAVGSLPALLPDLAVADGDGAVDAAAALAAFLRGPAARGARLVVDADPAGGAAALAIAGG